MMLIPLWRFLFIAVYVLAGVAIVAGLSLCTWGILRRGSVVRCVLGLGLMAVGFAIAFPDRLESPESRAQSVMHLPPEGLAQVVSAEYGDWAGDGTVVFRLPTNRPAQAWFEEVWKLNQAGGPNAVLEDEPPPRLMRTERVDEDRRSLEYDPKTQLYRYEVILGL